ncbi:MAG: sulfatase-like hydrolase/transferase [Verrucomicrobia bacterium]|nr:sulfatase-like hydrolase/transferase [Verrucomicrobiota bacterium]MCH8526964.1 sulfatase-like hydrolase/transferase [Kiritimatiellia bacterium]
MKKKAPNVLIFFTDQQRWDSSGLHGNPLNLMPHFDRLARKHTHVAWSFTCQPVCGPARACLQTGQYATSNGVVENGYPLPQGHPTLADAFAAAGYRTAYFGKWHLGSGGTGPVPPGERGGYQDWLAANLLEFTSTPYRTTLYDNNGQPVQLPGYRVDALADAAIRHIDRHCRERPDQPFMTMLSILEPHHQNTTGDYTPPDGYRERYTGRWTPPDLAALDGSAHQHLGGYWGAVKRIDEAFGRVMDTLKSLGIDRETIVLFTSDHGCHFGTRIGIDKRSWHESSIRVPTAFFGPGFEGGGEIQQLVNLPDLSATLLDAADIDIPDTFEGRSILPLLRGQTQDWPGEVLIQPTSQEVVARAVRTRRWKYAVVGERSIRETGASPQTYREAELYDLEYDPCELSNLAGRESHDAVASRMRERLLKRMGEIEKTVPTIIPAERRPGGQRIVEDQEVHQ